MSPAYLRVRAMYWLVNCSMTDSSAGPEPLVASPKLTMACPNSFTILTRSASVWWCRFSPQPAARTAIRRSGARRFMLDVSLSLRRTRACLGWRSARFQLAADDVDARGAPRRELVRLDREATLHFRVAEGVLVLPGGGDVLARELLEPVL